MFDLRTIAEVEGAGVKAGKHAEWREQIIVPPLPQSALAGCSLIDIEYFIQVRLCLCLFCVLFFDIAFIITRTPRFFFVISALLQSSLWTVNY